MGICSCEAMHQHCNLQPIYADTSFAVRERMEDWVTGRHSCELAFLVCSGQLVLLSLGPLLICGLV
jgi:hypothetical protein